MSILIKLQRSIAEILLIDISSIKILPIKNHTAQSYIIKTPNDNYFAKFYDKRSGGFDYLKEITFIISKIEFEAPGVVSNLASEFIEQPIYIEEKAVLLYRYYNTRTATNKEYISDAGSLLGKFHLIGKSINLNQLTNNWSLKNMLDIQLSSQLKDVFSKTEVEAINEARKRSIETIETVERGSNYGFVHGDYKLDNILYTDSGMVIADLDTIGVGSYYLDIGRFCSDITERGYGNEISAFMGAYIRENNAGESIDVNNAMLLSLLCKILWYLQRISTSHTNDLLERVKNHINKLSILIR